MSREEEEFVTAIERFTGKGIPRVLLPQFDYKRASPRGDVRRGRGDGASRARRARAASGRMREEELIEAPSAAASAPAAPPSFGRSRRKTVAPRQRRR
jgi:hypothetical protein